MSTYSREAALRTLEWRAGMATSQGRVVGGVEGSRRIALGSPWSGEVAWYRPGGPTAQIDLTDATTRLLVLAQLAERLNLDPTWGVTWSLEVDDYTPRPPEEDSYMWALFAGGTERRFHDFADITDPEEALLRALWATRPEEAR